MNIASDTMKIFDESEEYQDRIVTFIDVMGVKNKIKHSKKPSDFRMYATILNSYAHQPFAEGKLNITMFSDCMYIVSETQHLDQLICLLANFAYTMLMNRLPTITVNEDGSFTSKIDWDCFKLRGGITYGKVFVLDHAAKNAGIHLNTNIVLGPAPLMAYELESSKAVYPRIIADDCFISLIENLNKKPEDYYFTKDPDDNCYYIDFLNYMCRGNQKNTKVFELLDGCIEFVKQELDTALGNGNERLTKQLLWYIHYLESYVN